MSAKKKGWRVDYARIVAWAIVVVIPVLFLYLIRPTDGIHVNSNGTPNTLWGILSSTAQPTRFYRSQLDALDRSIASHRGLMDLIEEAEAEVKAKINQADIDASRERILAKYPELRPSEIQSKINALRREADKLEDQEWRRQLRESDDEGLRKLKATRKLVEQKLTTRAN